MKVKDVIEMLSKCNPEDEVKCFDGNTEDLESVTGMLYAGNDGIVELCTDDMNL